MKVYVASKSELGPYWRACRNFYAEIISTWIDESEPGETNDFADLWDRCIREASSADALIAYHREGDVWKGAFIEIGAALAAGKPVFVVGDPPGTWVEHIRVFRSASIDEAFSGAAAWVTSMRSKP